MASWNACSTSKIMISIQACTIYGNGTFWCRPSVTQPMRTCSDRREVRPPAVAGLFYAGQPHRLAAEVAGLLADAPASPGPAPKALIAPHAGYIYSGAVAAAAFASLGSSATRIERVVL